MRIVHAPHAYAPAIGGAEAYCRGLSEAMAAHGHEVHVVTSNVSNAEAFYELGHTPAGPESETIEHVQIHRIPYVSTPYRVAGRLATRGVSQPTIADRLIDRATTQFCNRLRSQIAQLNPDVILALPHLFPNVRCLLASPPDTPLVIAPMLHESDPNWPFDEVRAAVSRADAVIALTAYEAERLTSAYGADPDRVAVVPPGIRILPPHSRVEHDNPRRIVFVGRRTRSKNLGILLGAMYLVRKWIPDAELILAGSRGDLDDQRLLDNAGVTVVDSPSESDLRVITGSAQVLVSPSLRESFGIVLLEAWEAGTPVVVLDTPIARSIVADGEDGILAPPSEDGLARALHSLLDDPDLAAAMGAAGRKKVSKEYTWAKSAATLTHLYGKTIG